MYLSLDCQDTSAINSTEISQHVCVSPQLSASLCPRTTSTPLPSTTSQASATSSIRATASTTTATSSSISSTSSTSIIPTSAASSVCTPNPCPNGGTCQPLGTSFTCLCPQPYTGALCQDRSDTTTTTTTATTAVSPTTASSKDCVLYPGYACRPII